MNYVIATNRPWCCGLTEKLSEQTGENFYLISSKNDLTIENLELYNPRYVFFPHWSYIIPEEIHDRYECVIFHMTDLPYGRGGSPLQNLIIRGHKDTMLTSLRCVQGLDAGPVYMKEPLNLFGSAEEIYLRASMLIEEMIVRIIKEQPVAIEQAGTVVEFKRRKPADGDWSNAQDIDQIYDMIRMLDADGYPHAFIRVGKYKLEFTRASRKVNGIVADVIITEEG